MAKKKATKKSTTQQRDGEKAIKRAETRLAKALADVEDARAKVTRREQDLAAVLARHGRTSPIVEQTESVIALDAPASDPAANGSGRVEHQAEQEQAETDAVDQNE